MSNRADKVFRVEELSEENSIPDRVMFDYPSQHAIDARIAQHMEQYGSYMRDQIKHEITHEVMEFIHGSPRFR